MTVNYIELIGIGCPYVITRNWDVTDDCGNTTTQTQTIQVIDTTVPVITAPDGIITKALSPLTAVDIGIALATDNSDPTPIITNDAPAAFLLGDTIVTWNATDSDGNSAFATQTITLEDKTTPTFDTIPNLLVRGINGTIVEFVLYALELLLRNFL